jgi:hypothetical protein
LLEQELVTYLSLILPSWVSNSGVFGFLFGIYNGGRREEELGPLVLALCALVVGFVCFFNFLLGCGTVPPDVGEYYGALVSIIFIRFIEVMLGEGV